MVRARGENWTGKILFTILSPLAVVLIDYVIWQLFKDSSYGQIIMPAVSGLLLGIAFFMTAFYADKMGSVLVFSLIYSLMSMITLTGKGSFILLLEEIAGSTGFVIALLLPPLLAELIIYLGNRKRWAIVLSFLLWLLSGFATEALLVIASIVFLGAGTVGIMDVLVKMSLFPNICGGIAGLIVAFIISYSVPLRR